MSLTPGNLSSDKLNVLQSHIRQASSQLEGRNSNASEIGSLIYLGDVHDSYPRGLITDPILESEEIHTWMLMRLEVTSQFSIVRIPDQDTLSNQLKCHRAVVGRNINVLRALRWLTLCEVVTGPDGKFKGAVYAQHNEPLPIADTLELDGSYLSWLHAKVEGSSMKRLQHIKDSVLEHTDYLLLTQSDPTKPMNRLSHLKNKLSSLTSKNPLNTTLACPAELVEPTNTKNLYDANGSGITPEIASILKQKHNREANQVENFYMDRKSAKNSDSTLLNNHVNNFNSVESLSSSSSSSNNINLNKTTTTAPIKRLRIPECMSRTETMARYANDIARKAPPEHQQFVLDYVESQYIDASNGKRPWIDKLIKYMEKIVNQILDGEFDFPATRNIERSSTNVNTDKHCKTGDADWKRRQKELIADIAHLEKMIAATEEETNRGSLIEEKKGKEEQLESMRSGVAGCNS